METLTLELSTRNFKIYSFRCVNQNGIQYGIYIEK